MKNTKDKIIDYIKQEYGAEPEYLWAKYPEFAVFRHKENYKWFAVVLTIKRSQLGLEGDEKVDVLNVKGDPVVNGSLRMTKGVLPGYHMNKEHWLSVFLDESVPIELIQDFIDMSYKNTKNKKKLK